MIDKVPVHVTDDLRERVLKFLGITYPLNREFDIRDRLGEAMLYLDEEDDIIKGRLLLDEGEELLEGETLFITLKYDKGTSSPEELIASTVIVNTSLSKLKSLTTSFVELIERKRAKEAKAV